MQRNTPEEIVIALCDIDATLVSSQDATYLNQALLDKLKAAGIRDIFLFSTMYRSSLAHDIDAYKRNQNAFTRPALIAEMQRQGFTIHAVCVPADIVAPNVDYSSQIDPKFHKEFSTPGQPIFGKLQGGTFGHTYNEIEKLFTQIIADDIQKDYTQRTDYIKLMADLENDDTIAGLSGLKAGYPDSKGLMYEKFIAERDNLEIKMGGEIKGIVYLDDADNCRQAVSQADRSMNPTSKIPLKIIPVTPFAVRNETELKDYQLKNKTAIIQELNTFTHTIQPLTVQRKIQNLSTLINELSKDYGALGRKTHKSEFNILNAKIASTLASHLSDEMKYQAIIKLVEAEFSKEMGKFGKPFLGIGKYRSQQDFINRLNKGNKDYHYPRLLGLALQSVYTQKPLEGYPTSRNQLKKYVEQIKFDPASQPYNQRIPQLLGARYDEAYLALETKLKEFNFSPIEIYNFYLGKGHAPGNDPSLSQAISRLTTLRTQHEMNEHEKADLKKLSTSQKP